MTYVAVASSDWRLVTEDGQAGDEDNFDLLMSLLKETDKNKVLEPYYDRDFGSYFIDRWVTKLRGEGKKTVLLKEYNSLLIFVFHIEQLHNDIQHICYTKK